MEKHFPSAAETAQGASVEDKSVLERLVVAAKALADYGGLDPILERWNKLADVDATMKKNEERIVDLEADIKKEIESHKRSQQESLSTYTRSLDQVRSQFRQAEELAGSLEDQIQRKEALIVKLESENTSLIEESRKLVKLSTELEDAASRNSVERRVLNDALEEKKIEIEALATETKQKESQLSQLRTELNIRQSEFEKLSKQEKKVTHQLEEAQSITVSLRDEVSGALLDKLDHCFVTISKLVCSVFFKDIPAVVLENDTKWDRIKKPRNWAHQLPVPMSNSDAAKQMRSIIVLTGVVRAIDEYILQPTYFLTPGCGIRDLLIRQAQEDGRKESGLRAMMQAFLPRQVDIAATKRVKLLCNEVTEDFGSLLSTELATKFESQLSDIVEDVRDIWRDITLSKPIVQPDFALTHYKDWDWQVLRFQDWETVVEDAPKLAQQARDEPAIVLFPRLYTYDEDGPDPLTHGVLFMSNEIQAAKTEVERSSRNHALQRNDSMLSKRRKGRTLSTATPYNDQRAHTQSFLDGKA